MKKWPTSGWDHAGIAFGSASILAAVAGYLGERSALDYLNRISPHPGDSGWNSLGAFAGGIAAAFWTFPITFILIFVIQRIFAAERDKDNPADETHTDIQ
ncbi:MAG: hypothetical protein ABSE51_08080 [Terracidiphilus sp.]|jgi:phosphotransferase system  glucose/maltose/N-acetylglucosamine-specific IIC component